MLKFDKRRLQQVLLNLLSNAVKFQTGGIIRVETEVIFEDNWGNVPMLQVTVTDQGIGMSEEE